MNYIDKYPISALLYLIIVFISLLLAYYSDKKNSKFLLVILVIILSMFAGLRAESVGTDTLNYTIYFNNLTIQNLFFNKMEVGFNVISYVIFMLFKNTQIIFIVYSFLIVYFFVLRAWELRKEYSFTLMMLVFVTGHYLVSFNIMRQMLAVMIAFWSTRFVFQKNFKKFILVIIFASLIHVSALTGLIILVFYDFIYNRNRFNSKRIFIYLAIFTITFLLLKLINAEKYLSYFNNANKTQGILFSLSLCLVLCLLFLERCKGFRIQKKIRKNNIEIKRRHDIYTILFVFGLISSIYFSSYKNVSRVAYFFTTFESLFYGFKYDSKVIRLIKISMISVSSFSALWSILSTSGSGIMPYVFFWD